MKIGEVCACTGLTPRTVRFYIEEGLISPDFKRAYSGRNNVEFDEKDCNDLVEITLLRKASFSLAEIKQLRSDKSLTFEFAVRYKRTLQKELEEKSRLLESLGTIDENITYDEFLNRLNAGAVPAAASPDIVNIKKDIPKFIYYICLVLCFAAFSYLNILYINISYEANLIAFTIAGCIILFLSAGTSVVSFLKPKLGFLYIFFGILVAAYVSFGDNTGYIVFAMLIAVAVNAAAYVFYIYKTNALLRRRH